MSQDKIKKGQETAGQQEDTGSGAREDGQAGVKAEPQPPVRETGGEAENPQDAKPEEGKGPGDGKKDPRDLQIEELQDRLIRQMAEFDNFRKRTETEKSAM